MAIIFIRSIIIYITLLIIMRLMGKRQIGEMQPFEFIVTLLIAELACIPMADISIPILYGIAAMIAVFILHQFMTLLEQSSLFLKRVISGKPSIVITPNGVDFKELKKNNLDVSDLIDSMRSLGYYTLDAVSYAIYESNGKLTAIKSQTDVPPNCPLVLINEGKLNKINLNVLNLSEENIIEVLNLNGVKNLKNTGVLTMDFSGRYYLQSLKGNYIVGNFKGVNNG